MIRTVSYRDSLCGDCFGYTPSLREFLRPLPLQQQSIQKREVENFGSHAIMWMIVHSLNSMLGSPSISETVNSASPFSPETVFIELPMQPAQNEIALIPDEIDELQIDLRYQDDVIGISRPDLEVTIIVCEFYYCNRISEAIQINCRWY